MKSSIVKHSILIDGQKTSVSLEVTSGRSLSTTATPRSRDNEAQTMRASPSTAMVANEILIIDPGSREIVEIFQI